jgi:hypothetical protein
MASQRKPRGISFVSVLTLLLILGAIWWAISYGGAYWDNVSIKSDLHEAANLCLKIKDNDQVRRFILGKLSKYPDLTVQAEDVQIQRTSDDKWVTIDVAYSRTVKPLFIGGERSVGFTRHVEQDISPVKW